MRIMFYEPNHQGHHLPYLAHMLPAFTHLDTQIQLATTATCRASQEFSRYLSPFVDHLQIITDCQPPADTPIRIARQRAIEVINLAQKHQPDHLFVLYADGLWQVFAARALTGRTTFNHARTKVEGVLFRGGFSYPDAPGLSNRIKRYLFARLLAHNVFDRLLFHDELLDEFARAIRPARSNTQLSLTADPVILLPMRSTLEARNALGIVHTGPIISLSGGIDQRKGADLLIDAFVRYLTQQPHTPAALLLAGPHSQAIVDRLADATIAPHVKSSRIISLNRLLDGQEMFNAAAASDVVTAPYPNHSGRSSIILWAAAAGRRVLAVNRGCVDHVVQRHQLGLTCNVRDPDELTAALHRALEMPWTDADARRCRDYAQFHDAANYQRISSELVRKRLTSSRSGATSLE